MIILPEYGAACLVAHGAFGRYGQVAFHPLVRHGDVLQQQEKKKKTPKEVCISPALLEFDPFHGQFDGRSRGDWAG